MKSNVEQLAGVKRKLSIEVPAATVQKTFSKVLTNLQKSVALKGFRKGKAPLSTIRSLYESNIKQDVVSDLIRHHYVQALTNHELLPISDPEFEFQDPSENNDFAFTAHFDIRPEVKVKSYVGLDVPKEKLLVEEVKINEALERIRQSHTTMVDVLEERPALKGDTASVDFEGFVDGEPLENGKGEDHSLELGSNSFIEGFEEGVIGMSVGSSKTLHLSFPNPYHAPELAGKPVEFKVTLKKLQKKMLPDLNEEFIKTLEGPKDLEELKKNIRDDIEGSEKQRIEDEFKKRILKKLVTLNPVEVPVSLLKEQKAALVQDVKKRMSEQGLGEEALPEYLSRWDKDLEGTASEMVQSSFIMDAIAQEKNLYCTDADVEEMYADYAKKSGIDEEKIRAFYAREDQQGRLRYSITEKKVLADIISVLKITEVDKKDLPVQQ